MRQYHNTVADVLAHGSYRSNRTDVGTISGFGKHYSVDLQEGYPLLTTKKMDGYRWDSMIHELMWYLSGQEHIRELQEETSIWDEWADEDGNLDTAYGRFWRRYPIPQGGEQLTGESWVNRDAAAEKWVETNEEGEIHTFDQIRYAIDKLTDDPLSRRIVVNAWHPANASVSTLPPCHYSFVLNVQGDGSLNLHLTQRSADLALGVPFNIACYSLLLHIIAQQTGFQPGTFSHTLVDAHIYCGGEKRQEWYDDNLEELQSRLALIEREGLDWRSYTDLADWIEQHAPPSESDSRENPYDHVPGLLRQLSRDSHSRPSISVADKTLDELQVTDIELEEYTSHEGIPFGVAE